MGRSLIRSCAKLSYDHAQMMIDDQRGTTWGDAMPRVTSTWLRIFLNAYIINTCCLDGYSHQDLSTRINILNKVSSNKEIFLSTILLRLWNVLHSTLCEAIWMWWKTPTVAKWCALCGIQGLRSFCKFCDLNVCTCASCLQCLLAILCKQTLPTNDHIHTVKSYNSKLYARNKLWDTMIKWSHRIWILINQGPLATMISQHCKSKKMSVYKR